MSWEPDDRTPAELFEAYFVVGKTVGGVAKIRIDSIDKETLIAHGTVVDDNAMGFDNDEQVEFNPLGDECWRVTSERNDHGHGVYVGRDYGGISIGS